MSVLKTQSGSFEKACAASLHLSSQLGPADRGSYASLRSDNHTIEPECRAMRAGSIRPNSCSTMLCPVSKVAFWPKLFAIQFQRANLAFSGLTGGVTVHSVSQGALEDKQAKQAFKACS